MLELVHKFEIDGFAVLPRVANQSECDALSRAIHMLESCGAGTRRLLEQRWCQVAAQSLRSNGTVRQLIGEDAVAVQCTYFEKSAEQNWLAALHQDLSIPVRERIHDEGCTGWSKKEGVIFVQPPIVALEKLVAVRVHLDDSLTSNGPLRVVPGSHRYGRLAPEHAQALRLDSGEHECLVPTGDALVMRPLILHASSKSETSAPRRVLHFVFGPRTLPCGLNWQIVA